MDTRTVQRHEEVLFANVDLEVVMMSFEREEYFALVGIGPRIWELVQDPTTVDEISRRIRDEYDVDEATCRTDVAGFIDRLIELGFVRYVR